jgi:putative transposase
MIRSFRYPLLPNKDEEATLTRYLWVCASLYNAALQERRDAWNKHGASINYNGQSKSLTEIRAVDPEWRELPVIVLRSALRRVDRAFQAFFRRCKSGETPGHPRFRSAKRYDSFSCGGCCPVRGNRVHLPKVGYVKFNQYRPLRGKVLDAIVRREAGKWFVIFQCDIGAAPSPVDLATVPDGRIVGIDVGLRALATLSTGETITNPRHGAKAAAGLARRQRILARRKRGSTSRKRALLLVQKAYAKIANQRKDTAWKAAGNLVRRFDLIAYEDLDVAGMVHGNLAKSIHDAAWRQLTRAISCKAEEAGKHAVAVDPRGTSQECSGCGGRNEKPKTLAVRVHACEHCGLVLDRDHNAGLNIKARALGRSAATKPGADPGAVRSPKRSKAGSNAVLVSN